VSRKSTQLVGSLRIAILRSTLHEGSGQMIHISALTKGLERLGHEVTVFSREVEIKDRNISVQKMDFFGDNIPFFRNFVFPFRCFPSLEDFDIVHTQYHPGIFVGNVSKKLFSKPHVFTYHGFAPVRIWKNIRQQMKMIDHRIETFFALRLGVDKIITVSNFLKKELVDSYKLDDDIIRVIYNCIDTEKFSPEVKGNVIRKKYGLEDVPVVLFLGRLAPYKGVHYLIRSIPSVIRVKPEVKFLIAGSSRYDMLNLPGIADSLGVRDSVIFTGFVPDELVPNFYASCDVFCYTSLWEGFGLPVAEAGATGKPVVAFQRCAIPEVVETESTGLLVEPDHDQLAKALLTLLDDEKLREEMGRKARRRILRLFSCRKMVEKTVEVYNEVL
jgi:glycosyltransferase involved in cell wall biosynthesis